LRIKKVSLLRVRFYENFKTSGSRVRFEDKNGLLFYKNALA
jgi:hypothetical protein